jgi:hypothetical protein
VPTAIELGCANLVNACKLPNATAWDPPLTQGVTRTIEVGLCAQPSSDTQWRLGVFRADNRDDLLFVADNQAGFGYFKYFGNTRRQGIEAGSTTRVDIFSLGANLTLLDATYQSNETVNGAANSTNDSGGGLEGNIQITSGNKIPLVPRQLLKLNAGVALTPYLDLNMIGASGSFARGNENNAHQPDGNLYLGPGRSAGYACSIWAPSTW